MNAIYLRRRRKVVLGEGDGQQPGAVLAAMQKNLEALGFVMSPALMDRVRTLDRESLSAFYGSLIADLRLMTGAHQVFNPMYPGFPRQVQEMPAYQLYLNAIVHYITNRLPLFAKTTRLPLGGETELRVIDLGTLEDFESVFTRLASAKSSLSKQDQEDVVWFVARYGDDIRRLLPEDIPFKENLAVLGAAILRHAPSVSDFLDGHLQTATDVLRLVVAWFDGDVSLAAVTRFGSFKRPLRRSILEWIEQCDDPVEDMFRWQGRWVRLGERLHPGEYAKEFPKACAAFKLLRNDEKPETFNSRLEQELEDGNVAAVMTLLEARPGDFARRLDHLLRLSPDTGAILQKFRNRAGSVSTPVLLQMFAHFRQRDDMPDLRIFFPKGQVGKLFATPNRLPALELGAASEAASICEETLVRRFSKLPSLGSCRVDERLRKFTVPLVQRAASKSLRTLTFGSRLPMPDAKVLRFFIWWMNGKSRTDIDLSAVLFDADLRHVSHLSYYNLKDYGGCHSGDVVDAPQGASEFIDVEIGKLVEKSVRYIVMVISSFTRQPYCDLPECFAGWMARQDAASGEIFEPRTVMDRLDVASNTSIAIPAVFDLVANEVIWADLGLARHPAFSNNVVNNLSSLSLMLRSLTLLAKPDMHLLFSLHAKARGTLAGDGEKPDTTFSVDEGITPFEVDRIRADFL